MIHISMIIPAYNEEDYLSTLLDTIDTARDRYLGEASSIEVIVVDNASTDRTAEIARERGYLVVREEKRIIAAVRNTGVRFSRGKILAFTDADNQIHPNTFNAIDDAFSTHRVIAGATGVHLDRMSLGIAATFAFMMPMIWITGMDTGVVFCRRKDFERIGGYNEERFFAEDVQLLLDLQRLGKPRGERLVRLTAVKATTSTRKFDQFGDWHYLGLVLRFFLTMIIPGYSIGRLAQRYWYSDDRT